MAEAEEVITDVARHATIYVRDLWRRHRADPSAEPLSAKDVANRLSLFLGAAFAQQFTIRIAQPPAPVTMLTRMFRRETLPRYEAAIPATDGVTIWLPRTLDVIDRGKALARFRSMAILQASRAVRGIAHCHEDAKQRGVQDLFLLLEARAAELHAMQLLPGLQKELAALRSEALAHRPDIATFPVPRRALELYARRVMRAELDRDGIASAKSAEDSLRLALEVAAAEFQDERSRAALLYKDRWTGEVRGSAAGSASQLGRDEESPGSKAPRTARLARRPQVRETKANEDDEGDGIWMVQTSQPMEHAEDPMGMQRPTDRDDQTSADEFADSVSELAEARLVRTPGSPKEILLAEDPPELRRVPQEAERRDRGGQFSYPEWDWRLQAYRDPGATVHARVAEDGSLAWVERTLRKHRSMCDYIRRHFEMLRAQRQRLRKQMDGAEIDIDAYVAAKAEQRAGGHLQQALYQTERTAQRDLAVSLLIDISGSTDSWISGHRRVIDIERESLMLVCIALDALRERYNVLAFSGEGPHGVTVREVKSFEEQYGMQIAQRIAGLEPDRYTRVGAAMRHATALLMKQPAKQRLLLLLSDGKPNDEDDYEGRYGVEDMRTAATEARLQGISLFCLTIDRQAATYLPQVFGERQYALLPTPERLPTVLLEWLRRLVAS